MMSPVMLSGQAAAYTFIGWQYCTLKKEPFYNWARAYEDRNFHEGTINEPTFSTGPVIGMEFIRDNFAGGIYFSFNRRMGQAGQHVISGVSTPYHVKWKYHQVEMPMFVLIGSRLGVGAGVDFGYSRLQIGEKGFDKMSNDYSVLQVGLKPGIKYFVLKERTALQLHVFYQLSAFSDELGGYDYRPNHLGIRLHFGFSGG